MDIREVESLIQEFKQAGLIDTDAHRSAFMTLAHHKGWSVTRTARYLGITRVRASQRIARLHEYAATRPDMPIFNEIFTTAKPRETGGRDAPVGFLAHEWHDKRFAVGMIALLAEDVRVGEASER